MKKYLVKELATLAGINPQTLRRYEDLGVVHPVRGEENEYRLYEWRDFVQLLRARSLRNYGFGLQEVCKVYQSTPEEAAALYEARAGQIEREIEALLRQAKEARRQRERLEEWQKLRKTGFVLRKRPAALVFLYRREEIVSEGKAQRQLSRLLSEMPPFRSCVLRSVGREEQRPEGGLFAFCSEVENVEEKLKEGCIFLPECTCMVTAFEGRRGRDYDTPDVPQEFAAMENAEVFQMLAQRHGYELDGEVLSEVLHMQKLPEEGEVPYMENFRSSMLVWIPVRKKEENFPEKS